MKLSKLNAIFQNAKTLLNRLAVMITLSGCASTGVRIVQVDSFCEGKFISQFLEKQDYDNIEAIRVNTEWKVTIDKILDNKTYNEKEFEQCPALAKPQKQD